MSYECKCENSNSTTTNKNRQSLDRLKDNQQSTCIIKKIFYLNLKKYLTKQINWLI